MRTSIRNLAKLQNRLSTSDFMLKPTGDFLRSWREDLRQEAIERAPNWRGAIISSLQSSQDTARFPLYARVFSDVPEARWAEYGTGLLSDDPKSAKARYFPPPGALREWSDDYGLDPFLVARGIFRRGGTKPTHFFSEAEKAADSRLMDKMVRFGRAIEVQAGRG